MTNPIEGIAEIDLDNLSDHDLLESMRGDAQRENFFASRKLRAMEEFRNRRERDYKARKANDPFFTLTPIQETVVEVSPLLGLAPGRVLADLAMARSLRKDLTGIWALCQSGQLDLSKASMIWETANLYLKHPEDLAKLGMAITRYLTPQPDPDESDPDQPDGAGNPDNAGNPAPLVTKTRRQLQSRLAYWLAKFDKKSDHDLFKHGFKVRKVQLSGTQSGMGYLNLNHTTPDLLAADYRLTLIAKALLAQTPGQTPSQGGETRTLEQARADVMVDLLLGKLTVSATSRELEDEETADGGDPAETFRHTTAPAYARPVINVTVPIQTLMGLTDDPGVLTGGTTIPAALARLLAQNPDSTWYRMLTDPARTCVELSTKAYRPSKPIWRQVVAHSQTCYLPTCDIPATRCEIDHRIPYPHGPTSTGNLGPGCKRDHKTKHAEGFHLTREDDGTVRFRTRAGFNHTINPPEQPVAQWPDLAALDEEPTAEEFLNALRTIRQERESMENYAFRQWQEDKDWANYRTSYPQASDETIAFWMYDDNPHNPPPPPITSEGYTTLENQMSAKRAYGEHAFA